MRTSTAVPASTNAGKPRTGRPPTVRSTTCGSSSRSSGQARKPVRSSSPATASRNGVPSGRRKPFLQRCRGPCRGRLRCRRQTRPKNVTRRCGGSLSRSNASMGTRTPVRRRNSRCSAASSGSPAGSMCGQHRAGGVGGGNEVAAQVFRQRADERGDQFLPQRGHLPRELVAAQAREHVDRDVHRDTVVGGARLEAVGQRQRDIARLPGVRPFGVGGVVGAQQVVAGERQQVRCLVPLLLPPRVEVPRGHDIRRECARRRSA